MSAPTQPDRAQYRLIITRRGATEILLSKQLSGCSLPSVEVLAGSRVALQLVAGAEQKCQLETYCLLTGDVATSLPHSLPDRYAVMESRCRTDDAPPETMWASPAAAISELTLTAADQGAIRGSLDDLHSHIAAPQTGPFARPDWIDELFRWVQEQIEALDLRLTGEFQQLNASPTFSLLRMETTGAAVWFKATGEPNTRELGISVALDRLFPGYVPRVLGVYPRWNGWLTGEIAGRTLDDCADVGAWAGAARALAELQIASVAKTDRLLENGCRDLRLDQLGHEIEPFLARTQELMAIQTRPSPRILTDSEIRVLGDRLSDALAELRNYGIPNTLGHLDPNPRNIIVSPQACGFLDWSEGSVTHPLFTFEYLCEHARRAFAQPDGVREALVAAYLEPWRSFFSPEVIAQTMSLSPLLAVFACAVNANAYFSEAFRNPTFAGYFRSLVRRAHREAEKMAARSDRCLA
jgi:hypothetical protein